MGIIQINYLCLGAQQIIIIIPEMKGSGCRFAALLAKVPLGINGISVSRAHSAVGVSSAHGREHPEEASIAGGSSLPKAGRRAKEGQAGPVEDGN